MDIKAKFSCLRVEKYLTNENVDLIPVVSGSDENKSFAEATPAGKIQLTITNKEAFGAFKPGKEYFVDFRPANTL